jgi:hypothetical protein
MRLRHLTAAVTTPSTPAPSSTTEARFAVTEIGSWIRAADAKATVLTAAVGVVLAAASTHADNVTRGLHHAGTSRYWLLAPGVGLFLVSSAGAGVALYRVLTPRKDIGTRLNHFAWPSLASEASPSIPGLKDDLQFEAWEQAHLLSRIAAKKYAAFRWALRWFAMQALWGAVMIIAASWIVGDH